MTASLMTTGVLDVLRTAADRHGDKPAVIDTAGGGYTYTGLLAAVEQGAAFFRARGRGPVLLVPGTGPDDVVAMFAAIVGGAVPLIADKTWTAEECERIAEATRARAYVVSAVAEFSPAGPQPTPWPKLTWAQRPEQRDNPDLDGIGFGRFTSGTTGLPRSLGFTETAAVNAADGWRRGAGLTTDDVVLCLATLNNGLAFNTSMLSVFSAGATLVLHAGRPIPSSVARSIASVDPTVLVAFPFAFDALVQAGRPLGSRLRLAVSSAAPLSERTAAAWTALTGTRICDYYGLAEVGPVTFNDSTVPGSVGIPLDGVEVRLEPVADGGERVLVRTRSMARHFIDGREPALAESLTGDGFLRTRDLGRIDPDGRLRLVGRLGAVVNVAGRKIDPNEVRDVLRALPGVTDVVVRGETGADGELLAAYVESTTVNRAAVVEHCRTRLSVYKLPQRLTVLAAFPRTSTGKVKASALQGAQATLVPAQEEK